MFRPVAKSETTLIATTRRGIGEICGSNVKPAVRTNCDPLAVQILTIRLSPPSIILTAEKAREVLMDLGLVKRKALVCGASQGLGSACALALAQEGAAVTLLARRRTAPQTAAGQIEAEVGRRPGIIACDLTTIEDLNTVLAEIGPLDVLVTNAGGPPAKDFRQLSAADWDMAIRTNFLASVELIRSCVDGMIERGFGRIVNITSLTVRTPVEGLDLSTAARLALTGYVAGVARQIAKHNVTINNLLPGTMLTERVRELGATADRLIARVPAGRGGLPEEFGAACAFLCSTRASYIIAQNLLVDGGLCSFTV
jgi:3-oxoacyl-[acyl-carrier protein] reductase